MTTVYHLVCKEKKYELDQYANLIQKGYDFNASLVSNIMKEENGVKICLLNYEKYYLRNNSTTALTVMFTEVDGVQKADVIGSGGGNGIFNISWGANGSIAYNMKMALSKYGFVEVK